MCSLLYMAGCSDHCTEGEAYCKNDSVRVRCYEEEEAHAHWAEQTCDSMFSPEISGTVGTVCVTNPLGIADCAARCVPGDAPFCDGDFVVSCFQMKYADGTIGGYQWWESCANGCFVSNGVAQCRTQSPVM